MGGSWCCRGLQFLQANEMVKEREVRMTNHARCQQYSNRVSVEDVRERSL
jgi:hypothetical protein